MTDKDLQAKAKELEDKDKVETVVAKSSVKAKPLNVKSYELTDECPDDEDIEKLIEDNTLSEVDESDTDV